MSGKPNLYVIAGPNGSGKTTFAKKFLPLYAKCPHFINADLIAQGFAPFQPEKVALKAGRAVLKEIKEHLASKNSFAFETTLSGKTNIDFLRKAKSGGYQIHIFFLWIPNLELSVARIKDRVSKGGHNIPTTDVKRRFSRSINNFMKIYISLVDSWHLFDNSQKQPELIAKMLGERIDIINSELYNKIQKKFGK